MLNAMVAVIALATVISYDPLHTCILSNAAESQAYHTFNWDQSAEAWSTRGEGVEQKTGREVLRSTPPPSRRIKLFCRQVHHVCVTCSRRRKRTARP